MHYIAHNNIKDDISLYVVCNLHICAFKSVVFRSCLSLRYMTELVKALFFVRLFRNESRTDGVMCDV